MRKKLNIKDLITQDPELKRIHKNIQSIQKRMDNLGVQFHLKEITKKEVDKKFKKLEEELEAIVQSKDYDTYMAAFKVSREAYKKGDI